MRRPIVRWLSYVTKLGKFKHWPFFYYIIPVDLGKLTPPQQQAAKLDGYEKGVFDCHIICANEKEMRVYLIEFKKPKTERSPKGTLTDEQKHCISTARNTPVKTYVVYSLDEFIDYIEKELC